MDADSNAANDVTRAGAPRRRAGRPRLDSLVARHDDILAIALDLFIEHGYANVTLAMLASTAHMAVRTIYIKFGSKAGLLAAMVKAEHQRHGAQLVQLALKNLALRGRLQAMAQHIGWRSSQQRLLYLQAIVLAEGDETLKRQFHEAGPGQAIVQLNVMMEDGLRQGLIRRELDAALLCELFFSCVGGNRATSWQSGAQQENRWLKGLELFLVAVRPADRL